jgi:preprotein translocase subunit SecA
MKQKNFIFKLISVCTVFIFTVTTLSYSAPSALSGDQYAMSTSQREESERPRVSSPGSRPYEAQEERVLEKNAESGSRTSQLQTERAAHFTAPLAWKIKIPKDFGIVNARWVGTPDKASSVSRALPTVLILQDAHCNIEAQKNIAGIIRFIAHEFSSKKDAALSIFLEGAAGEIDVTSVKAYPRADIRNTICDYFLEEGKISGAEYAAITDDYNAFFHGVEDPALYQKNFDAFSSIIRYKGPLEEEVEQIEAVLNLLKEKMYSSELKNFEKEYFAFRSEEIDFFQYAKELMKQADDLSIDLFQFPNLALFKEVDMREGRIDFVQLETEVNSFLSILFEKLKSTNATSDIERLTRFTAEYARGAISNAQYFTYVLKLGQTHKVNLLAFTSFYEYTQYLERFQRIDKNELRFERRTLEKKIKETLVARHDTVALERARVFELMRLSEEINFTKSLINTQIFNQDIEDFEKARTSFRAKEYVDFILSTAPRYNIPYRLSLNSAYLDRVIPHVYQFYAASMERDRAMVENIVLQTEVTSSRGAQSLALLVSGGFHTHGLRSELEKRNISYVVVAPSITKTQANQHTLYVTRMLGGVDDFDLAVLALIGKASGDALRVNNLPVQNSFFAESFASFLAVMSRFAKGFSQRSLEHQVFQAGFEILAGILSASAQIESLSDIAKNFNVTATEISADEARTNEIIDLTLPENQNGRSAVRALLETHQKGSVTFKIIDTNRLKFVRLSRTGEAIASSPVTETQTNISTESIATPIDASFMGGAAIDYAPIRSVPVDTVTVFGEGAAELTQIPNQELRDEETRLRSEVDEAQSVLNTIDEANQNVRRELEILGVDAAELEEIFFSEGEALVIEALREEGMSSDEIANIVRLLKTFQSRIVAQEIFVRKYDALSRYEAEQYRNSPKGKADSELRAQINAKRVRLMRELLRDGKDPDSSSEYKALNETYVAMSDAQRSGYAFRDALVAEAQALLGEVPASSPASERLNTSANRSPVDIRAELALLIGESEVEAYIDFFSLNGERDLRTGLSELNTPPQTIDQIVKLLNDLGPQSLDDIDSLFGEGDINLGDESRSNEFDENDFGIAGDNSAGETRAQHEYFHEQGDFQTVISDIARSLGASRRNDGLFDVRSIVALAGGVITTEYGELRIESDGILVIRDSRFGKNHAGRGEYAVYAESEAKVRHELRELRLWRDFAIREGIVTERDVESGRLGIALRNWMNDVALTSEESLSRLQTVRRNMELFHKQGILAETEAYSLKASTLALLAEIRETLKNINSDNASLRTSAIEALRVRLDKPLAFFEGAEYDVALDVLWVSPSVWQTYINKTKDQSINAFNQSGVNIAPRGARLLDVLHEKRHNKELYLTRGIEGEISAYFGSVVDLILLARSGNQTAREELARLATPQNEAEERYLNNRHADNLEKRAIELEYFRIVQIVQSPAYQNERTNTRDADLSATDENIQKVCGVIAGILLQNLTYPFAEQLGRFNFDTFIDLFTLSSALSPQFENRDESGADFIIMGESLSTPARDAVSQASGTTTRLSFVKRFASFMAGVMMLSSATLGLTSVTESSAGTLSPALAAAVNSAANTGREIARIDAITDLSNYEAYYESNQAQGVFTPEDVRSALKDTVSDMLRLSRSVAMPSGETIPLAQLLSSVDRIVFQSAEEISGHAAMLRYDQLTDTATMYFNNEFLNQFKDQESLRYFLITTYAHEAQHAFDLRNAFRGRTPFTERDIEFSGWLESRGHFQSDYWERVWCAQNNFEYTARWEWSSRHYLDHDASGLLYHGVLAQYNNGELAQELSSGRSLDAWMVGLSLFEANLRTQRLNARIEFNSLNIEIQNGRWSGAVLLNLTIDGAPHYARFRIHSGAPITESTEFGFTIEVNDCGVREGTRFDVSEVSRDAHFKLSLKTDTNQVHTSPEATYIAYTNGRGKFLNQIETPGAFIRSGPVRALTNFITNIIARVFSLTPEAKNELAVKYVAPILETTIFALPSVWLGPWGIIIGAGLFAFAHIFPNFAILQNVWSRVVSLSRAERQGGLAELRSLMRAVDWKAVSLASFGNTLAVFGGIGFLGSIFIHIGTNTWRFNAYKIEALFEKIKARNPNMTDSEFSDALRSTIEILKGDFSTYAEYSAELEKIFPKEGKRLLSALVLASGFNIDSSNISEVIASLRTKMGHYLMKNYLRGLTNETLQRIARDVIRPLKRYTELNQLGAQLTGIIETLSSVRDTAANRTKLFTQIENIVVTLPREVALKVNARAIVFNATQSVAEMRERLTQLLAVVIEESRLAKTEDANAFDALRAIVADPETTLSEEMLREVLVSFGIDAEKGEAEVQEAQEALDQARATNDPTLIESQERTLNEKRATLAKNYFFFLDRMLGHVYRNNINDLDRMIKDASSAEELEMILNLIEGGDFIERGEAFDEREYDADFAQIEGQKTLLASVSLHAHVTPAQKKRINDLQISLDALRQNEMSRAQVLQEISKFGSRQRSITTELNRLINHVNQLVTSSSTLNLKDANGRVLTVDRKTIFRDARIAPLLKAIEALNEKIEILSQEIEMRESKLREELSRIESTEDFARQMLAQNASSAAEFETTQKWCNLERERLNEELGVYIAKLKADFNLLALEEESLVSFKETLLNDPLLNTILSQDELSATDIERAGAILTELTPPTQLAMVAKIKKSIARYDVIVRDGTQIKTIDKADLYASQAGRAVMQVYFTSEAERLKTRAEKSKGVLKGKDLDQAIALAEAAYTSYKGFARARRGQLIAVMVLLQQSKKDPKKYERMIAELPTGQGKTAVTAMTSFVQSLSGGGVFAISTTDFLANEGFIEASKAFALTGTRVGFVGSNVQGPDRIANYEKDITYIAIGTLAHDIATDQYGSNQMTREGGSFQSNTFGTRDYRQSYAVVDEIDSVSVFQAKTRFIRSDGEGKITDSEKRLRKLAHDLIAGDTSKLVVVNQKLEFIDKKTLEAQKRGAEEARYDVIVSDSGQHRITEKGRESLSAEISAFVNRLSKAQLAQMKIDLGLFEAETDEALKAKIIEELLDYCDAAVTANFIEQENKGYIVVRDQKGNPVEIVLMDLNTGVKQDNMRRRGGIHKALEAKHGAPIKGDSETLNSIAVSDLFNTYLYNVCGMTGTASSVKNIFKKLYGMFVQIVPPDTVNKRIDRPREIFKTDSEMLSALLDGAIENLLNGDSTLLISDNRTENYKLKMALARRLNMKESRDLLASHGIYVTFFKGRAVMGNVEKGDALLVTNATGELDQALIDENIIVEVSNTNNGATFTINTYDGETSKDLEKRIIDEDAGKPGAITLATNVGGRGSDYKLFEEAVRRGLRVFVNGIAENIGIDQQAKGRSARQTASGLTRQFISLERDWGFLTKAFTRPVFTRARELFSPDRLRLWAINKFWTFLALDVVKNRISAQSSFTQFAFRIAQYMQTRQLEFDLVRNLEYDVIETRLQQARRTFVDLQERQHLHEFADKDIPGSVKEFFIKTLNTVARELKEKNELQSDAFFFDDRVSIVEVSRILSSRDPATDNDRAAIIEAFKEKVKKDIHDQSRRKQILDLFDRIVNRPEITQTELIIEVVGSLEKPGFLTEIVMRNLLTPDESTRLLKSVMNETEKEALSDFLLELFGVRINVDSALKKDGETGMEFHSPEELALRLSSALAHSFSHAQIERVINDATGKLFSELETLRNKPAKEFQKSANQELDTFKDNVLGQIKAKRVHGEFASFIRERINDRSAERLKKLSEYKERSETEVREDDVSIRRSEAREEMDLTDEASSEPLFQVLRKTFFNRQKLVRSYEEVSKTQALGSTQQAAATDIIDAEAAQRREDELKEKHTKEMDQLETFLNPLAREIEQEGARVRREGALQGERYSYSLDENTLKIMRHFSADDDDKETVLVTLTMESEDSALFAELAHNDPDFLRQVSERGSSQWADIVKHNDEYVFVALSNNKKLILTPIGKNVSQEYARAVMDIGTELDPMAYFRKYHALPPKVVITDSGVIEIGDVTYNKDTVQGGTVLKNVQLGDDVTVERGVIVLESAIRSGTMSEGSYIKGVVSLANSFRVGRAARLEDSDIGTNTVMIPDQAEVSRLFLSRSGVLIPENFNDSSQLRGKFEGKKYRLEHVTSREQKEKVYDLKPNIMKRLWLKIIARWTRASLEKELKDLSVKIRIPAEYSFSNEGARLRGSLALEDLNKIFEGDDVDQSIFERARASGRLDIIRDDLFARAAILLSKKEFDKAEALYKKALKITGTYGAKERDAFLALAHIAEARGINTFGEKKAKEHFDGALKNVGYALLVAQGENQGDILRSQKRMREVLKLHSEISGGALSIAGLTADDFRAAYEKEARLTIPRDTTRMKHVTKVLLWGGFIVALLTTVGTTGIFVSALYKSSMVALSAGGASLLSTVAAADAGWYAIFSPLLTWVSSILPSSVAPAYWTIGGLLSTLHIPWLTGPFVSAASFFSVIMVSALPLFQKKLFNTKPKKMKHAWMQTMDISRMYSQVWSFAIEPIIKKVSPREYMRAPYKALDALSQSVTDPRDKGMLTLLKAKVPDILNVGARVRFNRVVWLLREKQENSQMITTEERELKSLQDELARMPEGSAERDKRVEEAGERSGKLEALKKINEETQSALERALQKLDPRFALFYAVSHDLERVISEKDETLRASDPEKRFMKKDLTLKDVKEVSERLADIYKKEVGFYEVLSLLMPVEFSSLDRIESVCEEYQKYFSFDGITIDVIEKSIMSSLASLDTERASIEALYSLSGEMDFALEVAHLSEFFKVASEEKLSVETIKTMYDSVKMLRRDSAQNPDVMRDDFNAFLSVLLSRVSQDDLQGIVNALVSSGIKNEISLADIAALATSRVDLKRLNAFLNGVRMSFIASEEREDERASRVGEGLLQLVHGMPHEDGTQALEIPISLFVNACVDTGLNTTGAFQKILTLFGESLTNEEAVRIIDLFRTGLRALNIAGDELSVQELARAVKGGDVALRSLLSQKIADTTIRDDVNAFEKEKSAAMNQISEAADYFTLQAFNLLADLEAQREPRRALSPDEKGKPSTLMQSIKQNARARLVFLNPLIGERERESNLNNALRTLALRVPVLASIVGEEKRADEEELPEAERIREAIRARREAARERDRVQTIKESENLPALFNPYEDYFSRVSAIMSGDLAGERRDRRALAFKNLSDIAEEIFADNRLTEKERSDLLALIMTLRDGVVISGASADSIQGMYGQIFDAVKEKFAKDIKDAKIAPFTILFDVGLLSEVYTYDESPDKEIVINLLSGFESMQRALGNMGVLVQPYYQDGYVLKDVLDMTRDLLGEGSLKEFSELGESNFVGSLTLVTTDETEFDQQNLEEVKERFNVKLHIMVRRSAFIPQVNGTSMQLLTLDILLARIASFISEVKDPSLLSQDFLTQSIDIFSFTSPIYTNVTDSVAEEIKLQSFKIAA